MPNKTIDTLNEWIAVMVEVVKDHGGPMKQDEAQRLTAKICGVSVARMPYVTTSAVADGLLVRGGLGKWDVLSLPE